METEAPEGGLSATSSTPGNNSSSPPSSLPPPSENKSGENVHRSKPGENGESHFGSYPVLRQPIWTVPPAGSEMPPREAFALTPEMIEFRAKKKVIAVTFANYAFMDFVTNWVRHLTDYDVTNILVGTFFLPSMLD